MIRFQAPPPLPVGYQVSIRNFLGVTLLMVLFVVLLGVIAVRLDPTIFTPKRDPSESLLWACLLLFTGVLVATGFVLAWRAPERWGIIGLVPPERRWVLIAVATGVVLFFIGERTDTLFHLGIHAHYKAQFGIGLDSQVGLISLFAALALLFPIATEVYFRGVLLNFLANRIGQEAGLFIAALLYAGLYFRPDLPISAAYGLVYGLAFGLLFLRSGSLWTAIIASGTIGALIVAKAAWA